MKKYYLLSLISASLIGATCIQCTSPKQKTGENTLPQKSELFVSLPDYCPTPDGMAIAPNGDLILACPNFADITQPACLMRITKDGSVSKWLDVPVLEETGWASPMGLAFNEEGDLFISDNQGWSGAEKAKNKGRVLRLKFENDQLKETITVASGLEHPNGIRIRDGKLYVTQSSLSQIKDPSGLLVSGVYCFDMNDRDIVVTNTSADKNLLTTVITKNPEVQYGLDKAERDKALLLAQKRQNSLYFALTILLLAVIAVVYLWRNLLRIKHLQHNLSVESQRAQESERLKRDFMGSMSHEIRTPLNAISGFAELIAGEDLTEEERREFVQIIRDNTQLFTSLINDMLEVSQLDNTSAELPRKLLDISKIIRAEMEHLPVKEGVEYRLKLAAPEIVFPLHRSYVSLLVRELLKNAVKFTEQGYVTVKCGLTGSDTLTLSVTDTGCGVEPGLAEKIFDRFYKGDPFAQGLGLGLSLCRLIVEKLGGTIALDTSYTGGARFVVTLRDA